jgi:hypothetical protein
MTPEQIVDSLRGTVNTTSLMAPEDKYRIKQLLRIIELCLIS